MAVNKDEYKQNVFTGKPDNIAPLASVENDGRITKDDFKKIKDFGYDLASPKYGAVLDGVADDSAAVAACLADALADRSAILIPAEAKIRVTQGFTINQPIKIIGSGHMNFDHGSNFYIEEATDPLFTVTHAAVEFHGVNFYYPLQDTTGTAIVVYPPTIRFVNGTYSRISRCRFFNTYDGVKYENGGAYNVDDVWMFTINKGFQIANSFEVNRFTKLQITYGAWINDFVPSEGMIEYTASNAIGMEFKHSDMAMIDHAYFFGLNKGVVLSAGVGDVTDNLFIDSSGWDSTRIGIEITGWANYLKISNSMLNNFDGKYNHHASPPEPAIGSNPASYSIYNTHEFTSVEISNCALSADGRAIWMADGDVLNVSGGSIHTYGYAAANDAVPGYGIHATNLSELYVTGVEMTNNPNINKATITAIYADGVDSISLSNDTFGNVNRAVETAGTIGSISRTGLTYKTDITNVDSGSGTITQQLRASINANGGVSVAGGSTGGIGLALSGVLRTPLESASTILMSGNTLPTTAMTTLFGVAINPSLTGNSSTLTNISQYNGFYARPDLATTFRGNVSELNVFSLGNPTLNSGSATNIIGMGIETIAGGSSSNYALSIGNPIRFRSNNTNLNTGVAGASGSIQYNNGSDGLAGGNYAKLGGADGGTITVTDLLWSGNFSQTFVKNSLTATDTDKPPAAAITNTLHLRIPVPGTAGYIPFGASTTAYTTDSAFFWDNTAKRLIIGVNGTTHQLEIDNSVNGNVGGRAYNTDATNTGAVGQWVAKSDSAQTQITAHGTGRTATRYGVTLGGWNELQGGIGNGLLIGTGTTATPIIFGTNSTEKMRIASSGLMTNANGGGYPFGMMYTDTSFTVTVASSGTWYEADTGATNFTAGLLKNVTQSDHYLVAVTAGYYEVEVGASLGTGAAGDKVAVTIAVNGTAMTYGHGHTTIANAASTSHVTAIAILNLAANDQVSIVVQNHSAARDIEIDHAQMKMKYIGSP